MIPEHKSSPFIKLITELGLLLLSALMFSLSFPGFHSDWGWFPLAFAAYLPLFIVIHRAGWVKIFIFGLLYVFVSYALFNIWLLKFHPLALIIVPVIYAFFFLLFLPLLKLVDRLFPVWGWLFQAFLWVGFEYAKTKGFLEYSYGVIGYSQYLFLPFIRIASLFGVWGVSLMVVLPSAFAGNLLARGFKNLKAAFKPWKLVPVVYGLLFAAALVFGAASRTDLSGTPVKKVALIQHNVDPWKYNYDDAFDMLVRLSREADKKNPDLVVWSETAFVPAIDYHTKYRSNHETYNLIIKLKDFMANERVPYVIGNDDGQLKQLGGEERIDYNAALLFEGGTITQRYWKTHLVPFTENFPFRKSLPRIFQWLKDADTHFWEKGTEYTVFEAAGIKFSTPICFEDTFGYLSREFVRRGAEIIVNLTNDSWSFSVPAMQQHLAMGLFRAVENRRTLVRSTNGGITCTIDPNGRVTSRLTPFTEDFLVTEVPVYTASTTLYTRWGDWFGYVCLFGSLLVLIFGIVRRIALTMRHKYRKI
ncbi:MAG: apolipoprotein N-acyltransferase [Spirochaetales bacterium]|nr:MAG: apolipoprotein N-acyltransferase [Spirochaetales bacterium]